MGRSGRASTGTGRLLALLAVRECSVALSTALRRTEHISIADARRGLKEFRGQQPRSPNIAIAQPNRLPISAPTAAVTSSPGFRPYGATRRDDGRRIPYKQTIGAGLTVSGSRSEKHLLFRVASYTGSEVGGGTDDNLSPTGPAIQPGRRLGRAE